MKITYSRDFLLSLSELDVCKKLPSGFDQSILGDINVSSANFSTHGFRRTEYGSSPPTKGEFSNYARGHGRWSSGRSDKDSDSQSDLDSDSGRHHGSQSRRPWQVPEHDGLLGSGSFPRPSGYTAGLSAPKCRANDVYKLNKSNEPYHPPRPYKAGPYLRRDAKDSYNDETFGSSEFTSEDRSEEERKRRASFELMRKEQVKAIHEKQKSSLYKLKDDFDISTLVGDPKEENKLMNRGSESDQPPLLPVLSGNSEKFSLPPHAPTSRPVVPPGFANTTERNIGTKSLNQSHSAEARHPQFEDRLVNKNGNSVLGGATEYSESQKKGEKLVFAEQKEEAGSILSTSSKSDKNFNMPLGLDISDRAAMDCKLHKTSHPLRCYEAPDRTEIMKSGSELTANEIGDDFNKDYSSSLLEKLFGGALTLNDHCSSSTEHHVSKADEIWSPRTEQSSKFAQWFQEEDQKPVDELISSKPNDLLSLIVGSEKGGPQPSDAKTTEHLQTTFPSVSPEHQDRHMASTTACIAGNLEQLYNNSKSEALPPVLTCEDLEQKLLLEANENVPDSLPPMHGLNGSHKKTELQKPAADDHASQHLLSLLQKGTGSKDVASSSNLAPKPSENFHDIGGEIFSASINDVKGEDTEISMKSGKTLTLETLFGTAFMNELQSVGAPVSVQTELGSKHGGIDGPAEVGPLEDSSFYSANNRENLQILTSAANPAETEFLISANTQVNIVDKLAALNSMFGDGVPSVRGQENAPFLSGPYGTRESDIPHNQNVRPTLQHHSSQLNLGGPLYYSLDPHPMNSQMKFMGPEGIIHHDAPNQLRANVFHPPFHPPSSGIPGFDPSPPHPFLQQMRMPGSCPPSLQQGFPQGAPVAPLPNNQVMPEINPVQGFPFGHWQPRLGGGPGMPVPADAGGGNNHPEALQMLFEMELRSNPKQIHPVPPSGRSRGKFGHEVDMGSGYR